MKAPDPEESLTARQKSVYDRLHAGVRPSDVAKELHMGPNGVFQHKRRMEEKGFKFPKVKRGRRKASKAAPIKTSKVVASNGHLSKLLGDVQTTVSKKGDEIESALKANQTERARVQEEVELRNARLGELSAEEEQLKVTSDALRKAVDTVPA